MGKKLLEMEKEDLEEFLEGVADRLDERIDKLGDKFVEACRILADKIADGTKARLLMSCLMQKADARGKEVTELGEADINTCADLVGKAISKVRRK